MDQFSFGKGKSDLFHPSIHAFEYLCTATSIVNCQTAVGVFHKLARPVVTILSQLSVGWSFDLYPSEGLAEVYQLIVTMLILLVQCYVRLLSSWRSSTMQPMHPKVSFINKIKKKKRVHCHVSIRPFSCAAMPVARF